MYISSFLAVPFSLYVLTSYVPTCTPSPFPSLPLSHPPPLSISSPFRYPPSHRIPPLCISLLPNNRLNLYLDPVQILGFQHFIALWKVKQKKEHCTIFAKNFWKKICTDEFSVKLHIFSFSWIHYCDYFGVFEFADGSLKVYNLSNFTHFFALILLKFAWLLSKYVDFCIFAFL